MLTPKSALVNPSTARRRLTTALAACVAVLGLGSASYADVLASLPSGTSALVRVKNLGETSARLGAQLKAMGLSDWERSLENPLDTLGKQAGVDGILDPAGEIAIAFVEGEGAAIDKAVGLIPVKDFDAFVDAMTKNLSGSNPAAKPAEKSVDAAGIVSIKPQRGEPMFISKWGNFAAMGGSAKAVTRRDGPGLKLDDWTLAQLNDADIGIALLAQRMNQADPDRIRNSLNAAEQMAGGAGGPLAQFRQMSAMGSSMMGGTYAGPGVDALTKIVPTQLPRVLETFMRDAESAVAGIRFDESSLKITLKSKLVPDSYLAKTLGSVTPLETDPINWLPEDTYLSISSSRMSAETSAILVNDLIDPLLETLKESPEDLARVEPYVGPLKQLLKSGGPIAAGVLSRPNDPVLSSQLVYVSQGDAVGQKKALLDLFRADESVLKLPPPATDKPARPNRPAPTTDFTFGEADKTVDGVAFDTIKVEVKRARGPMTGGPSLFQLAAVDNKLVALMNGSDDLASRTLATVQRGEKPFGQMAHIQATAELLPKNSLIISYVQPEELLALGVGVARDLLGFDPKVAIPTQLDPIGAAVSSEGGVISIDVVIPSATINELSNTARKIFNSVMGGGDQPRDDGAL
jgi:hypothetical protein